MAPWVKHGGGVPAKTRPLEGPPRPPPAQGAPLGETCDVGAHGRRLRRVSMPRTSTGPVFGSSSATAACRFRAMRMSNGGRPFRQLSIASSVALEHGKIKVVSPPESGAISRAVCSASHGLQGHRHAWPLFLAHESMASDCPTWPSLDKHDAKTRHCHSSFVSHGPRRDRVTSTIDLPTRTTTPHQDVRATLQGPGQTWLV